jgi:hypothetical protein
MRSGLIHVQSNQLVDYGKDLKANYGNDEIPRQLR